jgi:hypothetical protein
MKLHKPWWDYREDDYNLRLNYGKRIFRDLPRWHDNEGIEAWTNKQLGKPKNRRWQGADGYELFMAELGELGPLKKKYPHLVPYLRLPERARGKRFQKLPRVNAINAAGDVIEIRAMWQATFGKRNRSMHKGEVTAEEIAARRWGVDEEEVHKVLKALPEQLKKAKRFIDYGYGVGKYKGLPQGGKD